MRALIFVFLALLALPAAAQEVSPAEVIRAAVEDYIRPGFKALSAETDGLHTEMAKLCAAPSEGALEGARAAFKSSVLAFSAIEFVRVGPMTKDNRLERLLFWPDRKGIALRQVQGILGDRDESATTGEGLVGKSVAVQGFGALEFVLFGTGAEELAKVDGDFRCRYGAAIAGAVAQVAEALSAEWDDPQGIGERLMAPRPDYADFRSERESLEAVTGVIAHGVEFIRDTRLLPFLGAEPGATPKPKSALFWRSGMTMPAIGANFAGLLAMFTQSRIGEATAAENLWVDNGTKFEFGNAVKTAGQVALPVEQAVADPTQKKGLDYLVIVTRSLQTLVGENLAASLGLSVGFSSLDGD